MLCLVLISRNGQFEMFLMEPSGPEGSEHAGVIHHQQPQLAHRAGRSPRCPQTSIALQGCSFHISAALTAGKSSWGTEICFLEFPRPKIRSHPEQAFAPESQGQHSTLSLLRLELSAPAADPSSRWRLGALPPRVYPEVSATAPQQTRC